MTNTLPCLCQHSYCTQFLPNGLNKNQCSIKPDVINTSSCLECTDYAPRSQYLGKIKPCPGCGTAKITPVRVVETPAEVKEEPKILYQPISTEAKSNIDLDAQEIAERQVSAAPTRKFKRGK